MSKQNPNFYIREVSVTIVYVTKNTDTIRAKSTKAVPHEIFLKKVWSALANEMNSLGMTQQNVIKTKNSHSPPQKSKSTQNQQIHAHRNQRQHHQH